MDDGKKFFYNFHYLNNCYGSSFLKNNFYIFQISFCSSPLRELSNPGASGSIFYLTSDDEFIIKTVQHKEGEFLQKLLPGYYMVIKPSDNKN